MLLAVTPSVACHLCVTCVVPVSHVSTCHVTTVTTVSQYAWVPLEVYSRVLTEGQENLRKVYNEDSNELEMVLEKRMNDSRTHKREGYFVVEVRRVDGGRKGLNGREGSGWEGRDALWEGYISVEGRRGALTYTGKHSCAVLTLLLNIILTPCAPPPSPLTGDPRTTPRPPPGGERGRQLPHGFPSNLPNLPSVTEPHH